MSIEDPEAFVRANTVLGRAPLVPELRLHLASEVVPLWQATEDSLAQCGLPPPYWAFAWPGGQAVARYVLDRPACVAGRRVLDLAAGCGIAGLAAAAVGAMAAASEIDRFAVAAIRMNAAVNGLDLDIVERDLLGDPVGGHDVILAGDLCYERPMAGRVMSWLRANAAEGALVLLGDPGRAYRPDQGLDELVRYTVPTTRDLEDRDSRETVVWRVLG